MSSDDAVRRELVSAIFHPHPATVTLDTALSKLEQARKTLSKKYHPDKGANEEETKKCKCIGEQYKVLKNDILEEPKFENMRRSEEARLLVAPQEYVLRTASGGLQWWETVPMGSGSTDATPSGGKEEHADVSVPVPTIAAAALCEFDGLVSALRNKTISGECLHNAKPIRKLLKNKYKNFPISASDSLMQILDTVAKQNGIPKANERLHAAAIFFLQVLQSDTGGDPDAVPPTEGSVVAEGSARSVPNGSGDGESNADIDTHIDMEEDVESSIAGARQMPFQDDTLPINVPNPIVPRPISELTVDSRMLESATPNNASGSRKRKKIGGDVMTRNSKKKRVEDVRTRNSDKLIFAVKKKEIILKPKEDNDKKTLKEGSIRRYCQKVDKLLKGDIKGIPIYDMTNPFDVLQNAFDNHKDAIAENDSRSNGQLRNAIERFLELPKDHLQFETA